MKKIDILKGKTENNKKQKKDFKRGVGSNGSQKSLNLQEKRPFSRLPIQKKQKKNQNHEKKTWVM